MTILYNTDHNRDHNLVASIGMYDGVHLGHQTLIHFLKDVANQQGKEPAIVTFKEHPQFVLRKNTDLRMLLSLEDRLAALEKAGIHTAIVLDFTPELAAKSAFEFMSMLKSQFSVSTLVVGFNHKFGHDRNLGFTDYQRLGEELDMQVLRAPEFKCKDFAVSSSNIRRHILEGDMETVSLALGHPFSVHGTVVSGLQNGRKLGFPTANVAVNDSLIIIPKRGVYAVRVKTPDGSLHYGMANIGTRPTIVDNGNPTLEVNIFDFSQDLYGQVINVEFICRLRDEVRMSSFDELKHQLASDKQKAVQILSKQ